ncbi:hypothetical protein C0Z18_18405 [Trinickia dabaoshanensis]|uniref:Uncharacterized protein n=1 Tax=Trinickia dabaoshanensis TaxID=564714 RepID=A0A2N7VKX3_9BURK|nr:hypothetical protein [Trinickia dabaoshanensis]PMS17821.1 hypothetical protein C0Z18_18405 [Trinickia dabaoshanensis]
MRRLFLGALAATCFAAGAHAQSDAAGPFVTPAGSVQFERAGGDYVASLDGKAFDRFGAHALTHFDETNEGTEAVARSLVMTDSGPVLYDFRRRPPLVQPAGKRLSVRRVFWQGEDVVMQSPQGWFRLKGGVLTKLQSTKATYR